MAKYSYNSIIIGTHVSINELFNIVKETPKAKCEICEECMRHMDNFCLNCGQSLSKKEFYRLKENVFEYLRKIRKYSSLKITDIDETSFELREIAIRINPYAYIIGIDIDNHVPTGEGNWNSVSLTTMNEATKSATEKALLLGIKPDVRLYVVFNKE
jgi:hypothetical protein